MPAPAEESTLLRTTGWSIEVTGGPLKGQKLPLSERLTVGREAGNDLVIADPLLSRRHAVIEQAGVGYRIRDLGSRNGTLLNGSPVLSPVLLKPGDSVQTGDTLFAVVGPILAAPAQFAPPQPLPQPAHPPSPAAAPSDHRCPNCGATVGPSAKFCGSCGKTIAPPAAGAPRSLFCANCGQPVKPGAKFCGGCGSRLE
jgi:hypothetical protein